MTIVWAKIAMDGLFTLSRKILKSQLTWSPSWSEISKQRKLEIESMSLQSLEWWQKSQINFWTWEATCPKQSHTLLLMFGVITIFWFCQQRCLTISLEWKTRCWLLRPQRWWLAQQWLLPSMRWSTLGSVISWPASHGRISGSMRVLPSSQRGKWPKRCSASQPPKWRHSLATLTSKTTSRSSARTLLS